LNVDAAELEIFKNLLHSVAEEMGAALRRSAFSANIKERRDYSCAVFDGRGRAVAMGDHMPVHLGSMPMSVEAARAALALEAGDIAMLNDPYSGGTHLPDITLVMPVAAEGKGAARKHSRRSDGARPLVTGGRRTRIQGEAAGFARSSTSQTGRITPTSAARRPLPWG